MYVSFLQKPFCRKNFCVHICVTFREPYDINVHSSFCILHAQAQEAIMRACDGHAITYDLSFIIITVIDPQVNDSG
jgi:hypothetical protein